MKQLLSITVFALLVFQGCSDDRKKSEGETLKSSSNEKQAPKIKVVQNDAAYEQKVAPSQKSQSGDSYYFGDEKPKQMQKSPKQRTEIDANLHVRSPYDSVQVSLISKKMSKDFIVKCSPCHSDYANGIIGPSLLGKSQEYIYKKIKSFKSGESKNVLMRDLVKKMSDDEIKQIAQEIYELNKQIEQARSKR